MIHGNAVEPVLDVRGDLVLAALCVGQFRAPCQIEADHLLVRADEALTQALLALGLTLKRVQVPFTPAPNFAPDQSVTDPAARVAAVRRQVRTHVARFTAEDEPFDDSPHNGLAQKLVVTPEAEGGAPSGGDDPADFEGRPASNA